MSGMIKLPAARMVTLPGEILAALKGVGPAKPMRQPELFQLLGVPVRSTALDVLLKVIDSRAIGTAWLDRRVEGDVYIGPVYWLTGIPPQLAQAFTIHKHTVADAADKARRPRAEDATTYSASAGQAAAKAARISRVVASVAASVAAINPPPPPFEKGGSENQETTTMPRITAPAKPKDSSKDARATQDAGKDAGATQDTGKDAGATQDASKHAGTHLNGNAYGAGALQNQILAALAGTSPAYPLAVAHLHAQCPAAGSRDSTAATTRELARRGLVDSINKIVNGKRVNLYWRVDLIPDAGKMVEEPAVKAGDWDAGEAGGGDIYTPETLPQVDEMDLEEIAAQPLPEEAFEDIAQAMVDHARARLLSEAGRAKIGFAYDDSGALEIRAGAETLRLGAPTVARLARFLEQVSA